MEIIMKVRIGDVIGTTDGRFGEVTDISDGILTISEAADINEPCPTEATYFDLPVGNVASIV